MMNKQLDIHVTIDTVRIPVFDLIFGKGMFITNMIATSVEHMNDAEVIESESMTVRLYKCTEPKGHTLFQRKK